MGIVIDITNRLPVVKKTKKRLAKLLELEAEYRRKLRRPISLHHSNARRAAKIKRTPKWADMKAIKAIYDEAARRTIETGIQHHVDHIVPLQGGWVSGLHVENNLQILTATENLQKHNTWDQP